MFTCWAPYLNNDDSEVLLPSVQPLTDLEIGIATTLNNQHKINDHSQSIRFY